MNCAEVKELLSNYYDGELLTDVGDRVAAHLQTCQNCSAELKRFVAMSSMLQQLPASGASSSGWEELQRQLNGLPAPAVADRTDRPRPASRESWWRFPGVRPAMAAAALLLVVAGWFAIHAWLGHASHRLLAADIRQFVDTFEKDPQAAQETLVAKYEGELVGVQEAVRRVSYAPAAAAGLPPEYTVDGMYVLQMPCCDCLQTVCRRGDGSRFVIFEYGEEQPITDRPGGMACRGENCCLAQVNEHLGSSWQKGPRHISVVGLRDQAEADALASWLK